MNLGWYIDSLITVNLKIEAKAGQDVTILEQQREYYINEINTYAAKMEAPISFDSNKIYNKKTIVDEQPIAEAINSLISVVTELFKVQEFINLEKYKGATHEACVTYIERLNELNTRRNLYIDMVNRQFGELVNKKSAAPLNKDENG